MKRVVLVTGDSSGIGRATCTRLAQTDWVVYGASRSDVTDVAWSHVAMDVTDETSVAQAIAEIASREGQLDGVVHCAGQSFVGAVETATIEETKRHFDLNFFGSVRVIRAVLPLMREQRRGRIIVIGSVGGLIGLPFHGYYSAGKFALDGLIEALRRPEIAPFGVEASILHPGDIDTEVGENRVATSNSDASSPYHGRYEKYVAYYAKAERNGSPPDLVARQVERLLETRRLPVRSIAGKTLEKLGVVAKRLMISRHFEAVMRLAYSPGDDKK